MRGYKCLARPSGVAHTSPLFCRKAGVITHGD